MQNCQCSGTFLTRNLVVSPNSWCCRYETSNHLWLILEYCVGGDLLSLLRQDVRLPETSIHDIGRDLLVSLQYLHASSVIFCDLKPSNILLDENGRIKLGGFGFSLKLADINKNLLTQTLVSLVSMTLVGTSCCLCSTCMPARSPSATSSPSTSCWTRMATSSWAALASPSGWLTTTKNCGTRPGKPFEWVVFLGGGKTLDQLPEEA